MNPDLLSSKAWVNLGVFTTLLLGGVWWAQSPLTSSRPRDPQTTKLIDASFPAEKPYARPWQDPFEPYFEKTNLDGNENPLSHSQVEESLKERFREDFRKQLQSMPKNGESEMPKKEPLLLVGVMVPGGPFEDRTERRQRIRVALASAMAAGGYAPVDSEHLGSLPLHLEDKNQATDPRPCKIPYEWFEALSKEERRWISPPSAYQNILVFWISDDHFSEQPLDYLRQLRETVESTLTDQPKIEERRSISLESKSDLLKWSFRASAKTPSESFRHESEEESKAPKEFENAEFRIFGPWSSTTLKKLLAEADKIQGEDPLETALSDLIICKTVYTFLKSIMEEGGVIKKSRKNVLASSKLVFYNVFSTAPPYFLLESDSSCDFNTGLDEIRKKLSFLQNENKTRVFQLSFLQNEKKTCVFHYPTCPDSDLAKAMKDELERRGVDPKKDSIALIAENDTIYGRSLPKTFRREFLAGDLGLQNIKRFTYLRGLDGKVPREGAKSDSASPAGGNSYGVNSRTSIESRFMPTRKTNRPEGNNQFDYIIRLGDEMRRMERSGVKRFKAIGILGSDIYDKLLLHQTLKPLFPNAIFFTTDLDASFSHPQELEWTKNLLVASSHGFTLDERYQLGTAPFRFSYQTALFQAVLGATTFEKVDEENKSNATNGTDTPRPDGALLSTSPPRLFEIGWYQPYDISTYGESGNKIHPARSQFDFGVAWLYLWQFLLPLVFFGIALFVLNWHRKIFLLIGKAWGGVKWFFTSPMKAEKETEISRQPDVVARFLIRIIVAEIFVFVGFGIWDVVTDIFSEKGEPWYWGAGISAWPSMLFRLAALISSLIVFSRAIKRVRMMADNLCDRFQLSIGVDKKEKKSLSSFLQYCNTNQDGSDQNTYSRVYKTFKDLFSPDEDKKKQTGKIDITISELWDQQIRNIPVDAVFDALIGTLLWLIILALLTMEGNGTLAFRSVASYWTGSIVWALAWMATVTLVLTTFLITRSCHHFIKKMTQGTILWTQEGPDGKVTDQFGRRWNVDGRDISNLVDVYFIETWTSKISNLVLYPIASIVFLFVAESAYFDYYGYNPYRYVILLFVGLLVFAPAFQLRSAARRLRKQKIDRAKAHLASGRCTQSDVKYRRRIESAIEETENLKGGAFEPFLEHPFMQAILFLLGGISLPAFLGMIGRPF